MDVLRTPDDRFDGLPAFPFAPHYVEVSAAGVDRPLRMHHLDEGPRDAPETFLFLHGEPSWCYLYRHLVAPLAAAGYRGVAPDLIGFGRSDKPASRTDHTYARHLDWLRSALFDQLDLDNITLFCQDWGGLFGLRLVAETPDRFARVVAANTFLPTGDQRVSDAFFQWLDFSQNTPTLPVSGVITMGTTSELSAEVLHAYDAPFPDETYKEGARQLPALVPVRPDDPNGRANAEAWKALERFDKPFLTLFSDRDPITRGADVALAARIPGAAGQPHATVAGGHFLQEDAAPELVSHLMAFVSR